MWRRTRLRSGNKMRQLEKCEGSAKYKWVYICYVWIQIQTLLLTRLEVTEKACPLWAGRQNISSLAFVSYIQAQFEFEIFQLDCLVLIPSPPLPRLITTTQSPTAHSEETLSHPGLPHTDVIFPPPRPQTYRLQGFQVVLFQGLHVVLFQGFQDVLFLLLHGLQAAPPSAGLPIDLIGPAALQRLLISCLTYSSTYFPLIHCSLWTSLKKWIPVLL